jgi:predicted nucleotidyltransferase
MWRWGESMEKTIIHRDFALETLKKYKNDFEKRYGVTRIGIFGSIARDQARNESDVDIVVEMRKPDLFYMVHMKEMLENEFQRPVDIVHYRDKMNAFLKERINLEAVYV